jgi:hypothetical protein
MATSRCVGIEGIASLIRHMILQNGRGNLHPGRRAQEDHPGRWVLRRVASNGVVSLDNSCSPSATPSTQSLSTCLWTRPRSRFGARTT